MLLRIKSDQTQRSSTFPYAPKRGGPGHPMIDYHKRIIEEARKARVRMAREEEEEACRLMLSKALTSAQDAMETLETELEASYTPRHSTTVATSTVSVVSSPIPSRTHRTVA